MKVPRSPKMVDNMLDLPKDKRERLIRLPCHDFSVNERYPTGIPDRLCKTFAPVFLVRYLANQASSFYKALKVMNEPANSPELEIATSLKLSRLHFDYYRKLYAVEQLNPKVHIRWPIVIDGGDIINDTEGAVNNSV